MNFQELKNELCEKAKAKKPCASEYKRALYSENEATLLSVIYENLAWCINNECVSHEYFAKFDPKNYLESGIANTGKENTGYVNSGDRNSGDRNSGNWNSGDRNSGNWNSGNRNSGNRNSGYRNSGNWNSGDSNSGDSNSGDRNSGNWNSGNRNSGDSNSGYRNSGAFCTDPNPKAIIFNKESSMTVKEWENSRAFEIMANQLNLTFWINDSEMTEQEKKENPKYETTEGYLKTISQKEGWANMWGNLSDEDKKVFTDLENFDAKIFEEITGIKIK